MDKFEAIEDEIEQADILIKAAEKWSPQYKKDPKSQAKLIRFEAKLERILRKYFRDLSERVPAYVNWSAYAGFVQAFDVDVLIDDEDLDYEDGLVFNLLYDDYAKGIAIGADAGEVIYKRPIGISETSAAVQRAAREQVAMLVGKKVDKSGRVVDNPRADYQISNKTRQDIRESINTSLSLGETIESAKIRLSKTINNPKRAEIIAQTESVNAYQIGLKTFGEESGAVGKEWLSLNDDDECGDNANAGIIDLNDSFPSGDKEPAAHPRCRCSLRLVYPEEINQ